MYPAPKFWLKGVPVSEFWFWPISSRTIDAAKIFRIIVARNPVISPSNSQLPPYPPKQTDSMGENK